MADATPKIQVVDGDGQFLTDQVERFAQDSKLASSKGDYQVIAIMGPQSSGKSTLMNYVFGTNFVMMDAMVGRSQTTKGIWLSKSSKVTDHLTLVMDLEGNDGRERGEDDTNFERQIALFALAVSDVLLVNIWCHDIGREQGSGKPLLRTIFQVNLKLFAPDPNRKKTVLLFVIRDKTKTPLPKLTEVLEDDLNKMWAGIEKPAAYENSKMTDFFDVQYAGMSHFEEKQDDFLVDATVLRRRFSPDGDDSLVRTNDHLPGDAFALSVHQIWETIRSQKDLNLPAHKIMVANIRCAEIARDQLAAFTDDQAWQTLQQEACTAPAEDPQGGPQLVTGFNTRLTNLMDSCIQGYNDDALYFDASVRAEKLTELQTKLREVVAPAVQAQTRALQSQQLAVLKKELLVGLMEATVSGEGARAPTSAPFTTVATSARAAALASYKKLFTEHLKLSIKGWEGKEAITSFESAADGLIASLRRERVNDATSAALKAMNAALTGPIVALLDACPGNLWPKLHSVTGKVSESTLSGLLQTLSGFTLTDSERSGLKSQVYDAAHTRLATHVREAAQTRLSRMKDRFTELFTLDGNKAPRIWRPHENIPAIAREARLSAAQLLGLLAVFREAPKPGSAAAKDTGDSPQGGPADAVEAAVVSMASKDIGGVESAAESASGSQIDLMSVASWPGVDESRVLVQPHEVRTTWRDFMAASNALIQQAQATQQANRMAGNRMPPLWAIMAMLVLGWNEAMALIWNPVLLILALIAMLFGYSLYQELDVETEMSRGSLPGALALTAKIGPAVQKVLSRTWDALKGFLEHPGERLEQFKQTISELEMPRMDSPSAAFQTPTTEAISARAKLYAVDDPTPSPGAGGAAAANGTAGGSGAAGISGVSAAGLRERKQGQGAS